jgi:UDP:flavonoid glycosyltransferase YjiC (YdhE family)
MRVLLSPFSDRGYLYPAIALGRELRERGHTVHVLARESATLGLAEAGLPMPAVEQYGGRGTLSVSHWADVGPAQCQAVRRAARDLRADVVVTSVFGLGALRAAELLDLPSAAIGFAVHLEEYERGGRAEPALPLGMPPGRAGIDRSLRRLRAEAGLRSYPLTLLRGHPALEVPGAVLPRRVCHVGPLTWEPAADAEWIGEIRERVARSGKPVAYVHLGRSFGGSSPWPLLNTLFTGGEFQAVVEQGRSTAVAPDPGADLTVVRAPWMTPLLERADVVLCSGTSAPVLTALSRGCPVGLMPHGSEQPLLAQACVRSGVGLHLPAQADPAAALRRLRDDPALRTRATEVGGLLTEMCGAGAAADLIEHEYGYVAAAR